MSTISRREFLHVSTLAAAGVAVAACTPATTAAPPTATVKPAEKATVAPTATEEPAKWPRGDVPRNRTLINTYHVVIGNANPMNPGFNHQDGYSILVEPCAFYGAHADKTYMWLAESYKYNDNATECTITFRKGIEWSDGVPFTANDLAWSMTKLKTVDGLLKQGTYKTELDVAEVVDDLTLRVKLNQSDYRFFFKSLTFRFDLGDESVFVPQHIFKDVKDEELVSFTNWDPEKGWPVVTSPYTMVKSEATQNVYDLRPTWWAVKTGFVPKMPDVIRMITTETTTDILTAQRVINNEIDMALDIRPLVMASILAQTDHVTTWSGKKPPYGYVDWWPISIYFCNQKPPWDQPKLHWAVAYAVNQQQVIDVAWGGAGKATNKPFPDFAKLDAYMDTIKDLTDKYNVLEFNLDKSKALMGELGFTPNKDGFWADKEGVQLDANLYADSALFGDSAPVICEQLRKAGFASEHKAPQDVWAAKVDGRASLYLLGHGGSTIDPFDTLNLYQKANNNVPLGQQNWGNWARWSPDEAEAIRLEMNNTSVDDPKMFDLFRKWMTIYYEQLPDCPLCQWFHRIPLNTTYWDNHPTAENPYMNNASWHLTQLIVTINLKAKKL